jgi:hypothetical protein
VRRGFWVALGLGSGATGAVLVGRWARRKAEAIRPQTLVREAKGGLLDLSKLVAESIEEGKRAMAQRERELREEHDLPRRPPGDDAPSAPPAA